MSEHGACGRTWVLFPWFEELVGEVHPEDIEVAKALQPCGKVFLVETSDDEYVVIRYGEVRLRARPTRLRQVSQPVWGVGLVVQLVDGRMAEVLAVNWHDAKNEPFYTLRLDGSKTSRRYWNADIPAAVGEGTSDG